MAPLAFVACFSGPRARFVTTGLAFLFAAAFLRRFLLYLLLLLYLRLLFHGLHGGRQADGDRKEEQKKLYGIKERGIGSEKTMTRSSQTCSTRELAAPTQTRKNTTMNGYGV